MSKFYSEEHRKSFHAAGELTRTGGAHAAMCGAKTRNGGLCRHLPLTGHNRCLRHAGPKAANEFRERQRRDFERGKISYQEFAAAEAKRASNRLRDQWKKNAWLPGSTIDLGEHEAPFCNEIRHWVGDIQEIPPRVLDWLRWRYRRLQLDRKHDDAWIAVLRGELPRRVQDAGPRPERILVEGGWTARHVEAEAHLQWSARAGRPSYKRSQPDAVRRREGVDTDLPKQAKRRETSAPDATRVAEIVRASSEVLRPLMPACRGEEERSALVAALVAYVDQPSNQRARELWLETVRALRAR